VDDFIVVLSVVIPVVMPVVVFCEQPEPGLVLDVTVVAWESVVKFVLHVSYASKGGCELDGDDGLQQLSETWLEPMA
jgi:hypothetical protein